MRSDRRVLASLILVAVVAVASPVPAQLAPLALDRGATGLGLALRQVGTSGRVLYVTAHPDDEHNGVLVRLARGLGLHTVLLSLTRGEGGQNAIGPELFEALGVLRTEELMAMERYDAVERRFGRPYEFGYSFSVQETFEKWGREETLGDIVRVLRDVRPDVVLTLPLESSGGGQHHQAVARLTREAFRAAADPARFPEQVQAGLRPWQARKLYQGGTGGYPLDLPGAPVTVPTGVYDPLLGLTWQQLGSQARALHRCQGMSQLRADPGPAQGVYFLVDAVPPVSGPETDILDGLDTSLTGLARFAPGVSSLETSLRRLQERAESARRSFDPAAPERTIPALLEALAAHGAVVRELRAAGQPHTELQERLRDEREDLERALLLAQGLVVEVQADDGLVVPGQRFRVSVSFWNQGPPSVTLGALAMDTPPGWRADLREGTTGPLEGPGPRRLEYEVTVSSEARPSRPYWRRRPDRDRFDLDRPEDETRPWSPPQVAVRAELRFGDTRVPLRAPALFRYPGPFVGGEKQHVVQVLPELSVRLSPELTAAPVVGQRPFEVRAFVAHHAPGAGEARVRLEAPPGWSVEPAEAPLLFAYEGEEVVTRFRVLPPAARSAGTAVLHAVVARGAREYREAVQEISYDHIQRRQLVRAAETRVLVLDVRVSPQARVGYVMGPGDGVADGIRHLGVPLTLLDAEDLAFGDLSRFTTIVTGIRAYETRPDLRSVHPRLMEWVQAGGHLVVQYNRDPFNRVSPQRPTPGDDASPFAPYPAVTGRQRITDENAPLRVLVPEHPLFTAPNRIGESDWEGWVQERGTYFLEARDPRYVELLTGADPFPLNPGDKKGLLVEAKVGQGTWTYVGLVLFRQVPAGVPGGWRLLANLVSRPRGR